MNNKPSKKPCFKKIAIVGVGLIGGSIGLAIRKQGLAKEVVGLTKTKKSSDLAVKLGAIDRSATLLDAITGADLVILAAPVLTIIDHLKFISRNSRLLRGPVIDVGSSKVEIDEAAANLTKEGIDFIGCHPMAGSEKRGVENATADLFKNSFCFITRENKKISDFWRALGVKKVPVIAPDMHDAFVSSVSHLTHLLAFSLLHSLDQPKIDIARGGVNPSFWAFARLAQSDPQIWADVFLSNHMEVALGLNKIKKTIEEFEKSSVDREGLVRWLMNAKQKADCLIPDEKK